MPVSTIYILVDAEPTALHRAEPLSNLTISPQGSNFSLASPVFYVVYQESKCNKFPTCRGQYFNKSATSLEDF